ncbi:MAG: ClbS/DfsB family four-helix bundle protein [Caldilineaceae bacterium]|nr:ClbS/DfsB family four-helix bundle protein [Caldilineaceae bacterium]
MKTHLLAALREEFDHWERVLAGLTEAQLTTSPSPGELSIKDEIAHLWAWQQRSIARLEAGLHGREPQMPTWWPEATVTRPDGTDAHAVATDQVNARIYAAYRDEPWPEVYGQWRAGFLHFLELGARLEELPLLDASRYPWLNGYSLADVLLGSYEHHQEHLEQLLARRAVGLPG